MSARASGKVSGQQEQMKEIGASLSNHETRVWEADWVEQRCVISQIVCRIE
jgi:hypothetical protein